MSMSDPIADFLTRIRNGLAAKKRWVDVPSSSVKKRISLVLKEEKYINDFFFITSQGNKEVIRIFLKYDYNGDPVIENIKRVSKPGLRVYVSKDEIPYVYGQRGLAVLSTNQGVMTGSNARGKGVGGEVLFYVW